MHAGERWRLGHRPGLDGLRGIAIGLVVLAHAAPDRFVNGGTVGVTVFFALSGFLITSLLLDERGRTGSVSFRRFYGRRARRLLPALVVYLAFWTTAGALGWSPFRVQAAEVASTLLYFANWVIAAFGGMSYPTAITWSLSVEEQFYVLWPLTFLLARRWPRAQVAIAASGIVAGGIFRLLAWHGPTSWMQVYYPSQMHMDAILLGCLLALTVHRYPTALRRVSPRVGWLGIGLLTFLLVVQSETLKWLADPLLASAGCCLLIASVLLSGSRWLEVAPLRWLGRRSYALYLWHYPITVLAGPGYHWFPQWAGIALSLALAEVSWWVVERPFQRRRTAAQSVDSGRVESVPVPHWSRAPVASSS